MAQAGKNIIAVTWLMALPEFLSSGQRRKPVLSTSRVERVFPRSFQLWKVFVPVQSYWTKRTYMVQAFPAGNWMWCESHLASFLN